MPTLQDFVEKSDEHSMEDMDSISDKLQRQINAQLEAVTAADEETQSA